MQVILNRRRDKTTCHVVSGLLVYMRLMDYKSNCEQINTTPYFYHIFNIVCKRLLKIIALQNPLHVDVPYIN